MLLHLSVRDFVIVDRVALDFSRGFGALTGETGAGKSILIDALMLVLGERADPGVVRQGCDKADISAEFDVRNLPAVQAWLEANDLAVDDSLLLRRVIEAGGRSRAYINGGPATAAQLREVGEWLVDIHGQHAHQSLLRADAQRQLLDTHGQLGEDVRAVAEAWRDWRAAAQALREASEGAARQTEARERLQWQIETLAALAPQADEWPVLEQEHRRLSHASGLLEGSRGALDVLADAEPSCEGQIDRVAGQLADLAELDPALADVAGLLASVQAELAEAVSSLRRYADRADLDPARLAEVEARVDAWLTHARKYRVEPAALPALLSGWQAELQTLEAASDVARLEANVQTSEAAYRRLAETLGVARREVAQRMGAEVSAVMQQLALGHGRFEVALVLLPEGSAHGLEQVEFRIGGAGGGEARALARVASGGELSRISLAIQVLTSRSAAVPTLIFDEVDVGIGGGVAEIVGRLLRQLGAERQVLCVTHLPQVAAQAEWQWQVSKAVQEGQTLSAIEALDAAGRVREIARMLGGVDLTEITLQHAREMLSRR